MSLKPFNLSIETPCEKKYEELIPVDETCKFCTDCNKRVYDLSNCTPEEFLAIYKENNGKVCGRIVEEKPPKEEKARRVASLKYWLMSFLAFLGVSSCSFFNDPEHGGIVGEMRPVEVETIDTFGVDSTGVEDESIDEL
ncbi:MAG: hypothetical protein GY810_21130 [Aureispira sp.]|nr:hypothetical protein [Aureispira sp.]